MLSQGRHGRVGTPITHKDRFHFISGRSTVTSEAFYDTCAIAYHKLAANPNIHKF